MATITVTEPSSLTPTSIVRRDEVFILFYKMRGIDVDAGTSPPTYRFWDSQNNPDWTGASYTGPKSGGNPLSDITVISTYTITNT